MLGGSVSYLAGGKFGNGAATGAFQMAVRLATTAVQNSSRNQTTTSTEPDGVSDVVERISQFRDNIAVRCNDSVCMIDITLTVGGDETVTDESLTWVTDDFKQFWAGAFPNEGKYYVLNMDVSISNNNPDILVSAVFPDRYPNSTTPVDSIAGRAGMGGNQMELGNYHEGTAAHELGHLFGMSHQLNVTGSLMSYAADRAITGADASRLANRYRMR
jgi:hypothetical protein